nr:11772_t:CDS:2 [Entrophospora candida]
MVLGELTDVCMFEGGEEVIILENESEELERLGVLKEVADFF